MSDNGSLSSERSYIVRRKIRTNEEILQDLNAEVDISDGEYESDWSVGVDTDTDDEFGYSSQSNTNSPGQERLFVGFNLHKKNIFKISNKSPHLNKNVGMFLLNRIRGSKLTKVNHI